MRKKCLSALLLMLVLVTICTAAYGDASPFELMARPGDDVLWQPLGEETDVYLVHKGDHAVSVRSQAKSSAGRLYSWRRFALRAVDYVPEAAWLKVALPGREGFVQAGLTEILPREGRPLIRAYTETAPLGYVYLAALGELPLVMEIQNGDRHHQLLLPNDGVWQPVLLTLGAGKYTLRVYEAGVNDWLVRPLFETFFELENAPEDTLLSLYSSLHTNMESNPVTVALSRSLCKTAKPTWKRLRFCGTG